MMAPDQWKEARHVVQEMAVSLRETNTPNQ